MPPSEIGIGEAAALLNDVSLILGEMGLWLRALVLSIVVLAQGAANRAEVQVRHVASELVQRALGAGKQ